MKNKITKTTIEDWCLRNGLTLNWHGRKINEIPFVLADGDLYLYLGSDPKPAFTEQSLLKLLGK